MEVLCGLPVGAVPTEFIHDECFAVAGDGRGVSSEGGCGGGRLARAEEHVPVRIEFEGDEVGVLVVQAETCASAAGPPPESMEMRPHMLQFSHAMMVGSSL